MEGALEYEVNQFLSINLGALETPWNAYYKVAWKGYGIEHNSWEPESNVVNAPKIVANYWKRQAKKQAGLGEACACLVSSPIYTDVCLCFWRPL
jgi:hypothetical protein